MTTSDLEHILLSVFPTGQVKVTDLAEQTGEADHFHISVADESFRGKMLIDQHRAIQEPLKEYLDNGTIHAIRIKTTIPETT